MDLDLYFTLHTVQELSPTLDRLLSTADTIVVEYAVTEFAGRTEEILNRLSIGEITPEYAMTQVSFEFYHLGRFQPIAPEFDRAFLKMVANSCKRIYVERSSLTSAEFRRFDSAWKPPNKHPRDEGFVADYLRAFEIYLRSMATRLSVRDRQHALQLAELSRKHPESHTLVLRGATHRLTLEKSLAEQGLTFTSHLCDARVGCMLGSELTQKLALGLRVDRKELLMSVVQGFESERLCADLTMDDVAVTYKIVTAMSDSELESRLRFHLSARTCDWNQTR